MKVCQNYIKKKTTIHYYKCTKPTYKVVVESCVSIQVVSNQSEKKLISRERCFINNNKKVIGNHTNTCIIDYVAYFIKLNRRSS